MPVGGIRERIKGAEAACNPIRTIPTNQTSQGLNQLLRQRIQNKTKYASSSGWANLKTLMRNTGKALLVPTRTIKSKKVKTINILNEIYF